MKVFAVGDVHGCFDELVEAFAYIDTYKEAGDQIVMIGDYIDRGPKSKECVQFLIDRPEVICLKGNHEDMVFTSPPDNESRRNRFQSRAPRPPDAWSRC